MNTALYQTRREKTTLALANAIATIQTGTSAPDDVAARIAGQYRIWSYRGSAPRGHVLAAPFYAGVVEYADFSGQSIAEALQELSVLTNALFWVDDDGQGHFVARDLYDPGEVAAVDDLLLESQEDLLWDETVQYVEVSGGGVNVVSGNSDFAASGMSLSSQMIPNEAFAKALADSYAEFYSRGRRMIEGSLLDEDGRVYRPLDRVSIGPLRFLVYESDHDLTSDEIAVRLLEDA